MRNRQIEVAEELTVDARQAAIARYLKNHAEARESKIPRRNASTVPPLSWGQQQILLHSELAGDLPLYNEAVTIHRHGPLDTAALERALNEFIQRHEIMRTVFPVVDGQIVPEIKPQLKIQLPIEDLEEVPELERESEAIRIATENVRRPFDLESGPLFRVRLIRFHRSGYRLLLALHHFVFDGTAITDVLLPELVSRYEALASGAPSTFEEPELQYSDYACWQREHVTAARLGNQLDYWQRKLGGELPALDLPIDEPRPSTPSFRGAMVPFWIPADIAEALKTIASENQATPYVVLLAAFYVLLYRYTSQADILVGTIQSVRNRSELENMMGFFLNTVALRGDLAGNPFFPDLLAGVRETTIEAFSHADLPFAEVVESLAPSWEPGRGPFFDAFFSMNPSLAGGLPGWDLTHLDVEVGISKFDLHLEMDGRANGIAGRFLFKTDLFKRSTIERICGHWQTLLAEIAAAPDRRIDEFSILPEAEREQILVEWNDTDRPYQESRVHELVEAQAERTPQGVAVTFQGQSLTYRELNERANRLARWLVNNGAGRDVLIGVCMERSIEMTVSLLAVLKAGAAYLPLDPENPVERLSRVIEDANPLAILTQAKFSNLSVFQGRGVLAVDSAGAILEGESEVNLGDLVRPEDLAYVIYTSGSTGQPKGVMVPHRGICNRLLWMQEAWPLSPLDRVLLKTAFFFDVSVPEIFGTWMAGATLVIARPGGQRDTAYLAQTIISEQITQVHFVPSQLQLFLSEPTAGDCGSVRRVICSGEALTADLARRFHARSNATLLNMYGPTEASVEVSAAEAPRDAMGPVMIGRPIANTKLYILDRRLQPVPIGVVGELYISGDALARGYLNRPTLTDESFVPDPFGMPDGARMYRTGDLARYRSDGNIECLGRTDHQVKIRGFRVELGEIEAALKELAGIEDAVVVAREDSVHEKRLVAYLVAAAGGVPARAELRNFLKQRLPEYMIPADYVILPEIPISPPGKIDRKALPEPAYREAASEPVGIHDAPHTPTEETLIAIFRKVLRIPDVGVHDDFFDLGGHSLSAARAVSLMNAALAVELPLRILFQAQTVVDLAAIIDARKFPHHEDAGQWPALIPIQPGGFRPPLFCVARPNTNALGFLFLSRQLGNDQPLYGLQKQLVEDPEVDFTPEQYEATAAEYIRAIRSVQPEGPYFLTGYCQGAYIAFEMARQLVAQGQKIGLLGILDTWPEENTRYKWLFFAHRRLLKLPSLLTGKSRVDAWGKLYARLTRRSTGPVGSIDTHEVRWNLYWPGPEFQPPVYPGVITVFSISRQPIFRVRDFTLGWAARASGGVEVVKIPGEHDTVLREPHVQVLARYIAKRIALG